MTQHAHLDPSAFFLEGGRDRGPVHPRLHRLTDGDALDRGLSPHARADRLGAAAAGSRHDAGGDEPLSLDRLDRPRRSRAGRLFAHAVTRVFVGGLSMGSLLTLYLAAQHPDLPGAILYSPAVWTATSKIYLTPLARHFVAFQPKSADSDLMDPQADRQLWCYDVDPVGAAAELLKLILEGAKIVTKGRLPRHDHPQHTGCSHPPCQR